MSPRIRVRFLVMAGVLTLAGCMAAARVFLDLPDPDQPVEPPPARAETDEYAPRREPSLPAPAIEAVIGVDSVLGLLPVDVAGGVDWVAAVRQGTIRPRPSSVEGEEAPAQFGYDLYLGKDSGPEGFFPHSLHQEWVDCASCHPGIFRQGSVTPATVHEKDACGYCHGAVAFPIQTCERCHTEANDLPAGRQLKSYGDPVAMERLDSAQSVSRTGRATGLEDLDLSTAYPPAVFPHGPHRLRYQCRACHEEPFPMRSGGTVLTEQDAHGGSGCGACHDGVAAFNAGNDECDRCHTEPARNERSAS